VKLLKDGSDRSRKKIILAHGAGAPMDSDWMNDLTDRLVNRKVFVVRFEFPYMAERRKSGKKKPPDRMPKLQEAWREVFEEVGPGFAIGGKSMGGRVASLIADELKPKGLVCLGFPFHAPGKPMGDRHTHLKIIKTPTLILQGTRDSMGTLEDLKGERLSEAMKIEWMEDGDHSLKPRKSSGLTLEAHLDAAAETVAAFLGF
jgi:predicted alpha/beta-hydrolase family hydrolase